jgi:carboxylate-amine ligase
MLQFNNSTPLTMGVELELQIVNRRDYNLTRGSDDLLQIINKTEHGYDIKPEITESMIEIATSVHTDHTEMLAELRAMRTLMVSAAEKLNLGLAGGGAHPFQHWEDQRIYPTDRYRLVSELYGYLAKQFTVYGQHIHIGCPSGDEAIRLSHLLARHMPHFIALSASSPFYQGVDTTFQSSRLTSINAFPLSGTMPFVTDWESFNAYFNKMAHLGIVASMKDFYWDVRPKPEYGTVEIRVCDTPLTIETAVALGALRANAEQIFFRATRVATATGYVPDVFVQPLPGMPFRSGRHADRPDRRAATDNPGRYPCDLHNAQRRCAGFGYPPTPSTICARVCSRAIPTPAGCAATMRKAAR